MQIGPSPVCAELSERLFEWDGLARFHLLDAPAQRLVQLGAFLVVKVVPVVGNFERHDAALRQIRRLIQRESAFFT